MAEPVKRLIRILASAALCSGMALTAIPALAQELTDPTRPPSMVRVEDARSQDAGPVLQSVLISPGRKAAIISGKEVPLHGRYGKAKVIKITETEVVLRDGNSLQKLKLFPAIEKLKTKPGHSDEKG